MKQSGAMLDCALLKCEEDFESRFQDALREFEAEKRAKEQRERGSQLGSLRAFGLCCM